MDKNSETEKLVLYFSDATSLNDVEKAIAVVYYIQGKGSTSD